LCEDILLKYRSPGFSVVIVRPATVCGYSPRLRLDLIVNIFTSQAINGRSICVHGGGQMRPNLHIEDMTDLYRAMLGYSDAQIDGQIYNVGSDNLTVQAIAELVVQEVGDDVTVVRQEVIDARSYHICSRKIRSELGFVPQRTVRDGIADLKAAFAAGQVPCATTDSIYSNLQHMRRLALR
jgi:nucleoside-diphosphate-sugar epimerase